MFISNQAQIVSQSRTIQSVDSHEVHKTKDKLQSNFWGMSLFTLLLTLALLSMLSLHQNSKGKDQ